MKKLVSLVLAAILLLTTCAAFAEPVETRENAIVVGSTNQLSGYFFTGMWGNNTADMDVRGLLHGYSTVSFTRNGTYAIDSTVVEEVALEEDDAGNRTYIFSLNPDLVYNDGTPVRAQDYVFSVLLQSAPEIYALDGIPSDMCQFVGHEAYASGASDSFAGVRLMDDTHFALVVSGDYLPYFYELIYVMVNPYPMHVLAPGFEVVDEGEGALLRPVAEEEETEPATEAEPTADAVEDASVEAEAEVQLVDVLRETISDAQNGYLFNPRVTCGPYSLVSYDAENHVAEFEKNPYYLGNFEGRIPSIERITYRQVSNATLLDELSEGSVDLVNKVTSGAVITSGLERTREENSTLAATNYLRAGYGFLGLACEDGVTSSENVRKAIAYATDADGFVEDFLGASYGIRVYGHYGAGQWMTPEKSEQLNAELNAYALDVEQAKTLLAEDGWTSNAEGETYDEAEGGVRYKMVDDELQPLTLKWATLSDNVGCETLKKYTLPYLEEAGFQVEMTEMSFSEMLDYYYRKLDRTYDMFYMATNFDFVYDPYYNFCPDEAYQGERNTSGIADEELFRLAGEMRTTEVGDNISFVERWYALQQRFNEILPTVPLYSNVYFDFYTSDLYNYQASAHWSWASAILYATFDAEEAAAMAEAERAEQEALTGGTEETVEIPG